MVRKNVTRESSGPILELCLELLHLWRGRHGAYYGGVYSFTSLSKNPSR
ncbi:hypothetical protein Goshw_017871 [Gossypium schwendimanii]|uniref:Uncharacterized protein n=1 Tax=Gossypium schwendimanii TaxID=34291 RepID=A0A7J9N9S9_GOSSC|nr:hypothetical protein [Gossypium schwendimanii]